MQRFLKLAAGLSAAVALCAGSAQAATWVVDYTSTGGSPFAAALTLNTADTLNAAGGFNITGVSGNVDGDVVTGLIANPNQPFASYSADGMFIFDNVFFTAPGGPKFSNPGLFFTGASGNEYNLFSDNPSTYELYRARSGVGYLANSVGTITTAQQSRDFGGGAVPEPAGWTLMILGFGGVGALLRHRRGRIAVAA